MGRYLARAVSVALLAWALGLSAAAQAAAQSSEDEEEQDQTVLRPRGGAILDGTGAGQGEADPEQTPNPQSAQQMVGNALATTASQLDPLAPTPCYDKMPTTFKHRGQGRLYCWIAHMKEDPPAEEAKEGDASGSQPQGGGGGPLGGSSDTGTTQGDRGLAQAPQNLRLKHVLTWEDGSRPDGAYFLNAKNAFPAAAQKFADETGDTDILNQRVVSYKTTVTKYFDPGVGAYMDTREPAPVIDEVHWVITISGGYTWTFDDGAKRDCIYSGNGVATLCGHGKCTFTQAQQDAMYKGKPICLRCHATDG